MKTLTIEAPFANAQQEAEDVAWLYRHSVISKVRVDVTGPGYAVAEMLELRKVPVERFGPGLAANQ